MMSCVLSSFSPSSHNMQIILTEDLRVFESQGVRDDPQVTVSPDNT